MNRPLRGPQNPTPVDHATDTYDTIDWLVKNVPESNGKVGILGHLLRRLPAADGARRSAPGAQGVGADEPDGRRLDGRRLVPLRRLPPADDAAGSTTRWRRARTRRSGGRATTTTTTCSCRRARPASWAAAAGSSSSASGRSSSSTRPTTPSGATRRWTSSWPTQPLKVPVMLVHSLWDQEDIYGAIAVYKAIEPKDTGNDKVFLVMGPWHHGQMIGDGSSLGALKFGSDTGALLPPGDPAPVPRPVPEGRRARRPTSPPVTAFETGTNAWRRLPAWPPSCASGCTACEPTPLYLRAGPEAELRRAQAPATRRSRSTSPTPPSRCPSARARSSRSGYATGSTWPQWLVDDQREASGRPDVAGVRLRRADRAGEDQRRARSPTWSPPRAAPTPTGWSS